MKTNSLCSRSSLVNFIALIFPALLLTSCGGGAPDSAAPLVQARLFSFAAGSAPPGFPNALVSVKDGMTGAAIPNATVTMNGVALTYNSAPAHQQYEGTLQVNPGATVTLSVAVGGGTYAASGTMATSYPAISAPTGPINTWMQGSSYLVTWSGGAPLANSSYLLGILDAADPAGGAPYFQGTATSVNSLVVLASNSLVPGGHDLILGVTTRLPVASADPKSSLMLGGFSYVPVSVATATITPPALASMRPNAMPAGAAGPFNLALFGSGFVPQSVVLWNGSARPTTYITYGQLTAQISAADLAAQGTAVVTVSNAGTISTAANFTISAPAPLALSAISPASVSAGGPAFFLTVMGTNFAPTSVVQWNGTARATTYVSPIELLAQITAADIAAAGSASVTVLNPGAAPVTSGAATLAMIPPSKDAVAFQMNATHSGVINFNGVTLPTASKWKATFAGAPSYALTGGGNVYVTVNIPPAGGIGYPTTQLVALSQATGATVWGPVSISGAANAAYDNNTVFVVSSTGPAASGVMQAFDAATGTLKWSTALIGEWLFDSPPTAANGMVFTEGAGGGGIVYALNQGNGAIVWTMPVTGTQSSPAVSADGVYVVYPCQTYSFRPATGESIWWNNTGCVGGGGGAPVVANGVLYAHNGVGVNSVSTFNAGTGALLGSYAADNPPALDAVNGYFLQASVLKGIALSNNATLWSFAGDGLLVTSPIVVNSGASSYVFVGSSGGNLYALNAATGAQLWTINAGAAIPPGNWGAVTQISSLTAGNGLLFVPAGNTLTAYTLSTAP